MFSAFVGSKFTAVQFALISEKSHSSEYAGPMTLISWRFVLSIAFALAYLIWILRDRRSYTRIGNALCLVGLAGIFIILACDYIKTLPSHSALRTITGLATNRRSDFLDRSRSNFMLIEAGTGQRILCTTAIDGPWADQPVRATYVDDRRFELSVVRIEILDDKQFPWNVQKGHAGWVGRVEGKRRPPLFVNFLGFLFILVGAFAPARGMTDPDQIETAKPTGDS